MPVSLCRYAITAGVIKSSGVAWAVQYMQLQRSKYLTCQLLCRRKVQHVLPVIIRCWVICRWKRFAMHFR